MESSGGEGTPPERPEYSVYRSGEDDPGAPGKPDYKVYRSKRFSSWLRGGELSGFRERLRREKRPETPGEAPGVGSGPSVQPGRPRPPFRRILRWLVLGGAVWLLLSL